MKRLSPVLTAALLAVSMLSSAGVARGDGRKDGRGDDEGRGAACSDLPSHAALKNALEGARAMANGGFNLDMWATVVDRDGVVCAIAFTGDGRGDQWPGSRVISAQKANTANAFSLPKLALSTANLYTATQPGGSLFGLQASNPVDPEVAYRGNAGRFGRPNDPMVGGRIGGVNVFGGGLGLYGPAASWLAAWASVAIRRARTTTSPGGPAAH